MELKFGLKITTRFICLSVYLLSVSLSSYLSVFLSFCLSVFLSFCLPVFLSICLSVFLSFCLSAFLSFCLSVFLSVFLFSCLPLCPSVYLSVYLYICLCFSFLHISLKQYFESVKTFMPTLYFTSAFIKTQKLMRFLSKSNIDIVFTNRTGYSNKSALFKVLKYLLGYSK
jgi:hypothetical protein